MITLLLILIAPLVVSYIVLWVSISDQDSENSKQRSKNEERILTLLKNKDPDEIRITESGTLEVDVARLIESDRVKSDRKRFLKSKLYRKIKDQKRNKQ